VSWTRVLEGRMRDPLVGRDVLVGVLAGVLLAGALALLIHVDGHPRSDAFVGLSLDALRSTRLLLSRVIVHALDGLQYALGGFFMLLLMRLVLRQTWLAMIVLTVLSLPLAETFWTPAGILYAVGAANLFFVIVLRFGLLSGAAMLMSQCLLTRIPLTLDFNAWYAGSSMMVVLLVLGLAFWGFSAAMRGRRPQALATA
jgi:hypothetical protein